MTQMTQIRKNFLSLSVTSVSSVDRSFFSGLFGFLRVDQAVVVRVEFLENAARAEKFLPGQVAVEVPVHPLKPDRAGRLSPLESGCLCDKLLARTKERIDAADKLDMKVLYGLVLTDSCLAVPFQRSQRGCGVPFLATLHGRLDLPELRLVYKAFPDVPVVSISNSQREPLSEPRYIATVYHGLPEQLLSPGDGAGGYLAFLGRISPEKAPDRAIRIAARAGMKLRIAAKIDAVDREYFAAEIEPLLAQPHVDFIGEIAEHEKSEFLGNAAALLFPIAWREPFGLAMIEAIACGTPVIALRNGSVPEVIDEGVTGFIVDDEGTAAAAAGRLHILDRTLIRTVFEQRFTATRMAQDYTRIYQELISAQT